MNIKLKHILFLFIFILCGCNISIAQTRISERFDNKPLNEVFELLAKNYKIKFAYDNSVVNSISVTGDYQNKPIDEVLDLILKNTNLEMLFINDVYIIKTKPDKPIEETKIIPVKPIRYKILGIIKEKDSGESLPYATISIVETKNGTSTNTDGYFSILSDKEDSITLEISYLGFQPYRTKVAPLTSNKIITIELNRNIAEIEEVVFVKPQQELLAIDGSSGGAIQWNSKKNSDPPSLSNLDIAAPLQLLPGVDGTTESLSGLIVRHSPSDKNLFVYDGFTIYHIDHFFGAFTSFNSKAIKDIRITRGGFDSRWGGRASSVIEITGKTGNENKLIVDFGADQLSTDLEIDGPLGKKATFVFAARRSITDFYNDSEIYKNLFESIRSDISASKTTPASLTADSDIPIYYFYDLNAKISFKPSSKDVFSISGYQGYDNMKFNQAETSKESFIYEKSNWGNQGLGLRWSRQWNSNYYHTITAGVSNYNLFFDHLDYKTRKRIVGNIIDTVLHTYLVDNSINDININYSNELKIGAKNTIEFGVTENVININANAGYRYYYLGNRVVDTLWIYDNKVNNHTLWAQYSYSNSTLTLLKFGGRATYNSLTQKIYLEPRAQLTLKLSKAFSLKLATGIYYQFVNKILSYSNTSYRSIWKVSDGNEFPVVKSKHFIGGFIWDIGAGFSLDFEGYSKFTDSISFEQSVLRRNDQDKIVQSQRVFLLNNRSIGADFLLKKNWRYGQSWISYSLSRSVNKSDDLNKGNEYLAIDDHLSELKIVNVINLKRWNFTVAWIYGSGNSWDEIIFKPNTLQLSPDYEKNSAKLNPYHRMDLGISYNIKINKGDLKIGAKVFNLYNNINILSKPYQIIVNPINLDATIVPVEKPGMGFTTSFFVNIRF